MKEAEFKEEVLRRLDSLDKAVTIINEWLNGALEVVDKRIGAIEQVNRFLSSVYCLSGVCLVIRIGSGSSFLSRCRSGSREPNQCGPGSWSDKLVRIRMRTRIHIHCCFQDNHTVLYHTCLD